MSNRIRVGEVVAIQYLRGIAALLVVVAHASDQFHSGSLQYLLRTVGQGGVDIFFVISGYVMTYTGAIHGYSRAEFLRRRLVRIVPLYWVLTFATAALLFLAPSLARDSRFAWGDLVSSLLFIPHYNAADPTLITPLLKLGWTLNYEMFFYIAFAAVITFRPNPRTLVLTSLFVLLVATVALVQPRAAPLAFWGKPILFEFLIGCAIGCADLRSLTRSLSRSCWIIAMALGIVTFVALGAMNANLAARVVFRGMPATVIVLSAVGLERMSPPLKRNVSLHFLGNASYSIYLSHLFGIVVLRSLWVKLHVPAEAPWQAAALTAVAMVVGIVSGCLVHLMIERPLAKLVRRSNARGTIETALAVRTT